MARATRGTNGRSDLYTQHNEYKVVFSIMKHLHIFYNLWSLKCLLCRAVTNQLSFNIACIQQNMDMDGQSIMDILLSMFCSWNTVVVCVSFLYMRHRSNVITPKISSFWSIFCCLFLQAAISFKGGIIPPCRASNCGPLSHNTTDGIRSVSRVIA